MRNYSFTFKNPQQLSQDLREVFDSSWNNQFDRLWIQAYVLPEDTSSFEPLVKTLEEVLPGAKYMITHGGTAFSGDKIYGDQALVVCNVMEDPSTKIELLHYDFSSSAREESVTQLIEKVNSSPWIKLISFNTGGSLEGANSLNRLAASIDPDITVVGGAGSTTTMSTPAYLCSSAGELSTDALVVVLVGGEEFHARADVIVGWKGIGREFTVTKSEGPVLYELDGAPAFDVYRKYFKLEFKPGFAVENTIEFPFCYEDDGMLFLRCPFILNEDGSIIMMLNDLAVGQKVKLSFGSQDTIMDEIAEKLDKIAPFEPQVISINSCLGRLFFWGGKLSTEISSFAKIAPAHGYLTGGEMIRKGSRLLIFNETIVAVSMREGEKSADGLNVKKVGKSERDYSLSHRLATFIDTVTSDLEEYIETVRLMATTDELTGLFNRREVENRFDMAIARKRRFSVILLDADNFKEINDTYGHKEGDAILVHLAESIRAAIKDSKMEAYAGRWGGDEFLIVCMDEDYSKAIGLAESISKRYSSGDVLPRIRKTISVGIVHSGTDDENEVLFQNVDSRLYAAKSSGKNCIVS